MMYDVDDVDDADGVHDAADANDADDVHADGVDGWRDVPRRRLLPPTDGPRDGDGRNAPYDAGWIPRNDASRWRSVPSLRTGSASLRSGRGHR